jgi:hypothetical protein
LKKYTLSVKHNIINYTRFVAAYIRVSVTAIILIVFIRNYARSAAAIPNTVRNAKNFTYHVLKTVFKFIRSGKYQIPCAVFYNFLSYSKCYPEILNSDHRYSSVYKEIYSDIQYYQKCADKSIKEMIIDYIIKYNYTEIDLDEKPCIILFMAIFLL